MEEEIKYEDLSNNELLFKIKQLEADYDSIKIRMIKDYDELISIEQKYALINKIIIKRLKNNGGE